jgi:hypothetical protein
MAKTREYLVSLGGLVKDATNVQVLVKAYANLEGLAQACVRDKKVNSGYEMRQFWVGFSRKFPMVDFVDVGSVKEEADNKIRGTFCSSLLLVILTNVYLETLRFHLASKQCVHVLLACCHDTGYIPVLRHYAAQPLALERVTLLSGGNLRLDMSNLGFKTTNLFESLFSQGEWQVILQSSKSVRSKQKTQNAIAGGLQPQSRASPPKSSALPVRNGGVSKSSGESTPSAEGKIMTGWERLKPILRNNQGKRIDRPLPEDKNFIDAMRKADLCHYHYLKDDCKTSCHTITIILDPSMIANLKLCGFFHARIDVINPDAAGVAKMSLVFLVITPSRKQLSQGLRLGRRVSFCFLYVFVIV